MTSRRESRSAATGLNTLQEFENLRRTFKASNDRLAKKNNELLAQISTLNKQLQESAQENFELRGEVSTLQRNTVLHQARAVAFEREKQTMLDLLDEVNRANEWTRKNITSLRRSFDLVDNPQPEASSSSSRPTRPRQSNPSIAGVSKPPDMSRILEGGSDVHDSPRASPLLSTVHPPLSNTSSHTSGVHSLKARDSLSIPWTGTPVASSSTTRRTSRRPSGLISALDPTSSLRSSPPPRHTSRDDDELSSAVSQRLSMTDEFNPILSPLVLPPDDPSANVQHRTKDRDRARKRALSSASESDRPSADPDPRENRLYDVTNASPISSRKDHKSSSKDKSGVASGSDSSKPPPTPVIERRPKKSHLPTPSLSEDLIKHGDVIRPTKTVRSSASSVGVTSRVRTAESSSPVEASAKSDVEPASGEEGRERRVRKSVNYAEPKLNTKMRKPDGWEVAQKSRASLALAVAVNSGSSSPPQPDGDTVTKKRRHTTSQALQLPAFSSRHRSSSPLGDVDEPKPAPVRGSASSHRRKAIVDDLEDDGDNEGAQTTNDPLREGQGGLWPNASQTSSKPASKDKRKSAHPTNIPSFSVALHQESSTSSSYLMGRKRKAPSYSSSSPPMITPISDDEHDSEEEEEDDDEYVDERGGSSLPKSVSVRRQSASIGKRPGISLKSPATN